MMKQQSLTSSRRPVLYITRNGMLEPLGQSQVFSYLRGLSTDYSITLVSFEKAEDIANQQLVERVQGDCVQYGVRWLPQRFHQHPRFVAPAWSMLVFLYICLREVLKGNVALIHARSYIPAAVALLVNFLTKTPFIFDMRALWPEELITAGRLKRYSLTHKCILWVERVCLRRAAAVVSLTHAAANYLRAEYPVELAHQMLVINPTCADLDRFVPNTEKRLEPAVYSCLGTVLSGWFRLDWLATFFQTAAVRDSDIRFEVVTRDDPAEVRKAIGGGESLQSRLSVFPVPSYSVHQAIQRQSVSVMFYAGGELSELGRSPTRMAEILGCGLPVVANPGVGDVAKIITEYNVGVLVEEGTTEAMELALDRLHALMLDEDLATRCRQAAEAVFSLTAGTEVYNELYAKVLADGRS